MSVVVPTYNRADFVVDAVTSLLTQGVLVPEVIVVDDGSTDDTARALAGFGDSIVYVRQDNAGPSAARNTGVRRAGGELVAFLDSDNLCGPQSLDRRAARLAGDPDIDLVLGRTQVVELCDGVGGAPDYEPRGEAVSIRSLNATMVRRAALDRIGPFDERLRFGEDDDWFMRADELGVRIALDPEVSQIRRLHDGNATRDHAARRQALLGLLKNRLDRGRGAGGHDVSRSATDADPSPP